jgi:hypothetical protein
MEREKKERDRDSQTDRDRDRDRDTKRERKRGGGGEREGESAGDKLYGLRMHDVFGVPHAQPGSRRQVEEQPSPELTFPSSHCSGARRRPSPQTAEPI